MTEAVAGRRQDIHAIRSVTRFSEFTGIDTFKSISSFACICSFKNCTLQKIRSLNGKVAPLKHVRSVCVD